MITPVLRLIWSKLRHQIVLFLSRLFGEKEIGNHHDVSAVGVAYLKHTTVDRGNLLSFASKHDYKPWQLCITSVYFSAHLTDVTKLPVKR